MDTTAKIDKVIEECSELIQALCKVKRFGWFSHHPNKPVTINIEDVYLEMCDVNTACERLQEDMRQLEHEFHKEVMKQHYGELIK